MHSDSERVFRARLHIPWHELYPIDGRSRQVTRISNSIKSTDQSDACWPGAEMVSLKHGSRIPWGHAPCSPSRRFAYGCASGKRRYRALHDGRVCQVPTRLDVNQLDLKRQGSLRSWFLRSAYTNSLLLHNGDARSLTQ